MGFPEERQITRPTGGYRLNELAAAGIALLLPLLFVTSFKLDAWAPRYVSLPLVAAAGLAMLGRLLRSPLRRPALLAAGFLAWSALATFAAPDHVVSFWGRYSIGTGLIFMAAIVGAWALGASVRPASAALVQRALLAACLINAGVALVQQVTDLSSIGLDLYGGRSPGLFGNPAYLGELLAGGLWLALCGFDRIKPGTAIKLLVIGAAIAVSGSRSTLALAMVAALAAWPRLGWRRALATAVLVGIGLAGGASLAHAGIGGGGATAVERAGASTTSGIRPRLEAWRSALPAVAERPALGWGPSGFLAATSSRRTLAIARTEGPDWLFADAHNIVVEITVATGIPGLIGFLGWIGLAFASAWRRRHEVSASAPLAGFAAFCLASMLVEPLYVGVTPVALLALGAAGAVGRGEQTTRVARVPVAALLAVGTVTTILLAVGLIELRRAELGSDPTLARNAAHNLPGWAEPAAVVARMAAFRGFAYRDSAARDESLRWRGLAAHRDVQDPAPWSDWGGALGHAGQTEESRAAFDHALTRNPWSLTALRGAAAAATVEGDNRKAAAYHARAKLVTGRG